VEAVLNSRPFSALSEDSEDLTALNPGHFIRGAPLTLIPEPSLIEKTSNQLPRLEDIQKHLQLFWSRKSDIHHQYGRWVVSHTLTLARMILLELPQSRRLHLPIHDQYTSWYYFL
ncbi:GSCOCG00011816001-RA-CDS, partial [Cotesia congregata]